MSNKPLTFRSSKVVYYGPHPCENCGIDIAKMGDDFGGSAFTYPSGPIYPNTEWPPHVCDPFNVRNKQGREARERVLIDYPDAHAVKIRDLGFVILGEKEDRFPAVWPLAVVISPNSTFYDTELAAWKGAEERKAKGYPMWRVERTVNKTKKAPTDGFVFTLPQ